MPRRMRRRTGEPSIAELLSDPIAEALMRADRITVSDVLASFGWRRRAKAASALRPGRVDAPGLERGGKRTQGAPRPTQRELKGDLASAENVAGQCPL